MVSEINREDRTARYRTHNDVFVRCGSSVTSQETYKYENIFIKSNETLIDINFNILNHINLHQFSFSVRFNKKNLVF